MQVNATHLSEKYEAKQENQVKDSPVFANAKIAGISETDIVTLSSSEEENLSFEDEFYAKSKKDTSYQQELSQQQQAQQNIETLTSQIVPEECDKYEELGLAVDKDDPETFVTVQDRIQIELATYCEDYEPYGLSANDAAIEEVTGSKAMAQSVKQKLSDAGKKYLIQNELQPTIENLYKAEHSGTGKPHSISEEQWNQLQPQVEGILKEYGLDVNEENMKQAKWLVENQLPVSVENIQLLSQVEDMEFPLVSEELDEIMKEQMQYGIKAGDVIPASHVIDEEAAKHAMQVVQNSNDEMIDSVIEQGKQLNVLNLQQAAEEWEQNSKNKQETNRNLQESTQSEALDYEPKQEAKYVHARKVVLEIQLEMSFTSWIHMQKAGINIDTKPLEEMLEEWKNKEQAFAQSLFKNAGLLHADESQLQLFTQTTLAMEQLKSTSVYVIGSVVQTNISFTLQSVVTEGEALQQKLQAAGDTYETMATTVRKDMGDSIQKAFQSVDSLLEEIGEEVTDASRRAVRILGYNQMEITSDNIHMVKEADSQLQLLMKHLTPKTTAYLIKNNQNPLETDIRSLNRELEELNQQIGATEEEKYSEYLWKLDKAGEFTKEERAEYIGLYRLLHLVEKSDGSVIGSLLNQGSEITMKNLLHAYRSGRQTIEASIDDSFGALYDYTEQENSLNTQLSGFYSDSGEGQEREQAYYENLIKQALGEVSADKLKELGMENVADMSLEQFTEQMKKMAQGDEYQEEQIRQWQQMQVSENQIELLLNSDQKVNVENVMLISYLMNPKSGFLKDSRKWEEEEINQAFENLPEALTNKESMQEAYDALTDLVQTKTETILDTKPVDSMSLALFRLQKNGIGLMQKMSRNETYYVPMEIQGRATNIRLTIRSHTEESGKVTVDVGTEEFGQMSCQFKAQKQSIDGILVVERKEVQEFLQGNMQGFTTKMEQIGFSQVHIQVTVKEVVKIGMWETKAEENAVSNQTLYQVAKAFMETIKEWGKELN